MPTITLPDGSSKQFDKPVTVAEVAASIGPGLAKAALAGKLDGKLRDIAHVIAHDAALTIVTDKDAEGLEIIRHSTAHLLAQAVKQLFPDAQVTIGPVIEDGFYYDFAYQRPFNEADIAAIEKRMQELAAKDQPISRSVMPRDQAVRFFEIWEKTTRRKSSQASLPTRKSRCIGRAISSIFAAGRMCRPPAGSRPSI